jgi:hypothetical protein
MLPFLLLRIESEQLAQAAVLLAQYRDRHPLVEGAEGAGGNHSLALQ